jgi:hypothetical protein
MSIALLLGKLQIFILHKICIDKLSPAVDVTGGFDDVTGTSQGLGQGEIMPPEAPISLETSPRGSGGMEFVIRAASD